MKKFVSKIKLVVVALVFGLSWTIQANVPLTELKNSFAGLKKEFQHLSPLHGTVAWISGYTKNIYRIDDRSKIHALAKSLFHELPGGDIVSPNAPNRATTYLTPKILGIIVGMLAQEQLIQQRLEAQKKEYLALQTKFPERQQSKGNNILILDERSLKKRKLTDEGRLDTTCNKFIKLEGGAQKVIQPKKNAPEEDILITKVTPLVLEQAKASGKHFKEQDVKRDFRKLIANLREALKECENIESGYPHNTPVVLLLSFLHVISTGKQDLQNYYQELEIQLDETIKIANDPCSNIIIIQKNNESQNNIMNLSNDNNQEHESYTINELVQKLAILRESDLTPEWLQRLCGLEYEKTVLALLSGASLGEIPDKIEYCKDSKFETATFPNCLENTLRYIINVLLYNTHTEQFDFEMLKINSPGIAQCQKNFDQKLKDFFEKNFNSGNYQYSALSTKDTNKHEIHDAWNNVVCNRDWCCYGNIIDKKGKIYKTSQLDVRGFLKLSVDDYHNLEDVFPGCISAQYDIDKKNNAPRGVFEITLKNTGHKYLIFDPEKFKAYDLAPSIRNVIIMLDQLLGTQIIGDIKEIFDRNDFNTKLWPVLCEKLNITCENAYQHALNSTPDCLKNIDAWDFSDQCIMFNLTLKSDVTGKKKFAFFCEGPDGQYLAHSDYHLIKDKMSCLKGLQNNVLEQFIVTNWNDGQSHSLISSLLININPDDILLNDTLLSSPVALYYIRHLPIHHSDTRFKIMDEIFTHTSSPHRSIQKYVQNLIRITEPASDLVPQRKILESLSISEWIRHLDINFYEDKDMLISLVLFVRDCSNRTDLKQVQEKIMTEFFGAENATHIIAGEEPKNSIDIEMSLKMAEKYTSLKSYEFNEHHESIITFIFEQLSSFECAGQGNNKKNSDNKNILARMITIAQNGCKSMSSDVANAALILFEALFQKNLGFKQAIQVAQEIMKHDYDERWEIALNLFRKLFEKGQGFNEAIQAAQTAIKINKETAQEVALDLFDELIQKGKGFKEATLAAQYAIMQNDYQEYMDDAVNLFKKLFEKGHGFCEAVQLIQNVLQKDNADIKEVAREVLTMLVKTLTEYIQKKENLEVVESVMNAMNVSENPEIQKAAQELKMLL